uniref:G-protein coupled receptors family 1 profile domain-containing protein n=1 Tax=Romanomermis culicivorax TaxID=13658 RepID=A0A915K8Z1_ROMCU
MSYNNSTSLLAVVAKAILPDDFDANACIRKSDATKNLALAVAYLIMIVVGIVGNAIVVTVTMKVILSRKLLTNVYIYVACLSAVDLGAFSIKFKKAASWSYFGSQHLTLFQFLIL